MAIINEEKTLMGIMNSLPGVELKEKLMMPEKFVGWVRNHGFFDEPEGER